MSFFKKIQSLFSSPSGRDKRSLWIYVRCGKCGELIKGRVDLYNDLSIQYDEAGDTTYFCRKVFIGSKRCYSPIEVELSFNKNRVLQNQEIKGGEFISEEVYIAED